MSKYLVIVESPAKAKTIEKFLGKNYHVESSMGHIRDLPKSKLAIDVDNDFEPQYISIRGKGDLIKKLKKEASKADKVYLATDPDREGEAISWHLAYLLNIDVKDKCRITFNEITSDAVKKAIKEPRVIDMDLVDAQQARRVLDRLVGYKISPILWKKVKKGLSAGRVQSVALKLIVDRENEIENFVPEEYWTLIANLLSDKKKLVAKLDSLKDKKGKLQIKSREEMDSILSELKEAKYIVSSVKNGQKKRNPYAPFTTSTMQQDSVRKLNFAISKTMRIAQQLYEGINIKGKGQVGLITYMRTDSTRISNEALTNVRKYINDKYGKEYLPEKSRIFKTKANSQDAHEAIRPTYMDLEPDVIKDSLSLEQYKLYKLIWSRFVASQMMEAVYDTISSDIEANNYIFKATGSRLKFAGYLLEYKDISEDDEIKDLPVLEKGKELNLKNLEDVQHFTEPPARYTEASLVKTLEERGIGRPSTYAPTIATIIARNYVKKESKNLLPSELGKAVDSILKEKFKDIIDVDFTADMEGQLDNVEEGNKKWKKVIEEFYPPFNEMTKRAEEELEHIKIEDEVSDVVCEKCGRLMVYKFGRYGKFLACPGFPECKNAKPIVKEIGVDCPKCHGKLLEKKSKKGKKYYGCEHNPDCDFMTWDIPTNEKCPKCGSMLLRKKGKIKSLECINESCDYKFSDKKSKK